MKVAITGSSGFVGKQLSKSLLRHGHSVIPVVRSVGDQDPENQILWDPQIGLANPQRLSGVDVLIHLAGKSIASERWTDEIKREIRDSRVRATDLLARQVVSVENPPSVVISASAIGIYGDRGDELLDESSVPSTDFLAKIASDWEQACEPLRDAGIRVAHPRFGIILGEEDGALAKMLPLFRWGLGGRLGDGHQYWSWVSIDDCVDALIWMMETPSASGPYNVVSPNPLSNREFTNTLASHLKRPALIPAPAPALRLALGEMADAMLLSSCRVFPKRLIEGGFRHQHGSLAEFLSAKIH